MNKSKYPDGKHPLGIRRILAKRIVPSAQITPDFEYDKKSETYFKPLVKIHKVKKMAKRETNPSVSSDSFDLSSFENDESKQDIKIYDINGPVPNSNRDLHYLKPKEKNENDESEQDITIYDINGPIHTNRDLHYLEPKEKKENDESEQDFIIYNINGPVHNSNRDLHYLKPKEKQENDEFEKDITIYDINGPIHTNRDLHYLEPKEKKENDESEQDIIVYNINGPLLNSNRDVNYLKPKEKKENDESEQDIKIYDINGPIHKNNRKKNPKEKKESQNINKKQENIRMSIEEQGARFLKDIQQMTHLLQDKRQKNIIKDKVSVIVQELENLHGNLFDLVDKTVHLRAQNIDVDNMISLPLSDVLPLQKDITVQENKLKNTSPILPHNPIWNFWTYKKTLLIDECPGDQVRIGRVCVKTPEHRRRRPAQREFPFTPDSDRALHWFNV
ncbi:uncharacterized protein LOC113238935 [Hyposmocoma kahamanoa]|uniref:uncharacterized protein LOC113238935 n=1 Tax=Hyposmocoma kahamanoa TaxID=1477025 RepID=UPI000E6D9042|nr:uncharacterized protein LOC113238935 [Hyposmocoma kahamanoa]